MSKLPHDLVERKFIESYDIEDYEVLTDTGFRPINYLHKTIEYETWELVTDSRNLQCADTHIVFDPEYNEIFVKDLIPNKSLVITDRGPEIVRSVKNLGFLENMFDLTIDSEDHRFYTDGILSHNSITTASYILWYVFFHPDSTVYILANKAATAREILARVKAAYERTPFFLQPGASVWNKGSIELGNTSKIVAAATTSDSIRGQTANLVALDEFAFVENAEDFFKSTYPVISSGETSKIIITSTPNGLNYFHKLWKDAEENRSDFVSYEISWDKVPGRDEKWKRKQIALLGEHGFRQEYGNEFLGSSNTLISGNVLQSLTWETPLTISDDNVWKILEQPKEGHRYIVILDPSRGQEVDYTSMVVIDYTEIPYKIVATYHSNDIRPLLVPSIIVNLGKKYNEAYLLIERNSIGQAIVESCWYDLEYENIFGASTKDAGQRLTIGFSKTVKQGIEMTTPIKKIGCSNLKTLVEEKKLIGFTDDIFGELCTFVSTKNSWGASQGKHDDLVMCLVLFSWVSTQKFFKEFSELDIVSSLGHLLDDMLDSANALPAPIFSNFNETNKYRRTSENSWLL